VRFFKRVPRINWTVFSLRLKQNLARVGTATQGAVLFVRNLPSFYSKDFFKTLPTKARSKVEQWRKIPPREFFELMTIAVSDKQKQKRFILVVVFVSAYVMADTVSLLVDGFVPSPPSVPQALPRPTAGSGRTLQEYAMVTQRNIFSSRGIIPEEDFIAGSARLTRAPIRLIGTMVFADVKHSIATLEDQAQHRTLPVQVGDMVLAKLEVTRIEETRVYFMNHENQYSEYAELPVKQVRELPGNMPSSAQYDVGKMSGISKTDDTHYDVERGTIEKSLANLGEVLQQAKAIPSFENGAMTGYRIVQVSPGSIYEQLGVRPGDVVTSVNNTPVTDPGKAMAMLNDLKSARQVQITVKRNGVPTTMNYTLR